MLTSATPRSSLSSLYTSSTVQHGHHVGVLLDGAGFAQVGQLRLGGPPLFHGAAELREGHHGDVELPRQGLESAGDVGDFLLAVLGARTALHELQVIDDDKPEVTPFAAQAARLGTDVQRRLHGGVVDVDVLLVAKGAGRVGQRLPVLAGQEAGAYSLAEFDPVLRRTTCARTSVPSTFPG